MRLFALLSGEHEKLPRGELEGALEAENVPYSVLEGFTQVYRFKAPLKPALKAFRRVSLSHFLCEEIGIFGMETSLRELVDSVLGNVIRNGLAFRVRRVRESLPPERAMSIEAELNRIASRISNLMVNLENPSSIIDVVASDGFLIVGRRLCVSYRSNVFSRSGSRKPFFHPSSLRVELARAMLNLARVRKHSVVIDPFSGTGTILMEAHELRAHPLGMDMDPRMAYLSMRNYRWFGVFTVNQVLGDAGKMPFRRADAVVTDPPYGRRASTHGSELIRLYESFLTEASRLLRDKGRIVFLAPDKLPVEDFLEENGLKLLETYFIKVHTALTRKLLVASG
ncbi:MAG: DNA methyltransferase [Thermoproteota archaeon]